MARWEDFETEAPELAGAIRVRFEAHETHVLATVRRDGSPRVSGSEVQFDGSDLTFGSMAAAIKVRDLRRDGRCAIHAHPDHSDAKVSGVAVEVRPDAEMPPGGAHIFRLELTDAVLTTIDQDAQEMVIQLWRPGRGVTVIRRR